VTVLAETALAETVPAETVLVETPFIIVVLSTLRTVPGEAFP